MADEIVFEQDEKKKAKQKSLGEYLKRERLLRNITLEEISQVTKISLRFLKALEEDNYRVLPAEAFVKGFLRAYAKTIGVDPNEVVLVYNEYSESRDARIDLKSILDEEQEKIEVGPRRFPMLVSIGVSVVLLGALYFGWLFFQGREPGAVKDGANNLTVPTDRGQSAISAEVPKLTPKKKPSISSLSQMEPFSMQAQAQSDAQWLASNAGKNWLEAEKNNLFSENLSLSIRSKKDIWAKIMSDPPEGTSDEVILSPGMSKIWFAKEKFMVSLNKFDGVKLELNGKEINADIVNNQLPFKEIIITREGIQ